MASIWADEYEEDDFLDNFEEAIEVPEPGGKRAKLLDDDPNSLKEPKKPRIVQNPRPKLDMDTMLNEEKGLPELLRMGNHILFQPGQEFQDMKKLFSMMQLWSHRLFPKYTFKDFLMKAEGLGKKRPIKTHLRKASSLGVRVRSLNQIAV